MTLTPSLCQFTLCSFKKIACSGYCIYGDDASLRFVFNICLFYKISASYVVYVYRTTQEIQDRCCYSDETVSKIYASSVGTSAEIVNSTVCTNSKSEPPFLRCATEIISLYNNHSFLSNGWTVCCYDLSTAYCKTGKNCFFHGSSCTGNFPIAHASSNEDGVITKFNVANCTDTGGFIWLSNANHKIIKDSVLIFRSTKNIKLIRFATTGATVTIEGCKIVASSAITSDEVATIKSSTITTLSASTFSPFLPRPAYKYCLFYTRDFTSDLQPAVDSRSLLFNAAASLMTLITLV